MATGENVVPQLLEALAGAGDEILLR